MRRELAGLQRWMQEFITDPGADRAVVARTRGRARALVKPSRTLKPEERISIYRGMYLLRMHEALLADFPLLEAFIGHEAFHRLVADYVAVHPSRSYSFNGLREHLPAFVAGWRPAPKRLFASELAALECAIADSFDAPRSPVLSAKITAAIPATAWRAARLVPVASLRVLEFRYPVNDVFTTWRAGAQVVTPARRASWLAIYRRDDRVWRLPLSRPAFALLGDLAAGRPLGLALRRAAGANPSLDPGLIHGWFSRWVSEGIFAEVKRPARRSGRVRAGTARTGTPRTRASRARAPRAKPSRAGARREG